MIRLASYLWLWFQSVCPLIPSLSAYCLTWVSLTLDVGSLFTAAPAKHSCCSLPLMRVAALGHPLTLTPMCICAQLSQTLCGPMDRSLLDSSAHGILPGKNTWVGCHFLLQGSSWLRDWTHGPWVSCIVGRFFTTSTTWEAKIWLKLVKREEEMLII